MSKKATEFQRKAMSRMYRGKEIFKPLNTGWTDNMDFAFAHKNELCSPFKKRVHDPNAPSYGTFVLMDVLAECTCDNCSPDCGLVTSLPSSHGC